MKSEFLQGDFTFPFRKFFQIQPDILLGLTFGEDKKLCSLSLSGKYSFAARPAFARNEKKQETKDILTERDIQNVYSEVIRNLSASLNFGKLIEDKGGNEGNCYSRHLVEYEFAFISSHYYVCDEKPTKSSAVYWKRDACNKINQIIY